MTITTIMRIEAHALRLAMLVVLWWLLTGGAPGTWIVGVPAVAAAFAAGLAMRLPESPTLSIRALLPFLAFFALASVRGGVQVATRALRRHPDLHPAIVHISLHLHDERAQLLLVSVVNVLPGTLATALHGTHLRLHILDDRNGIEAEVRDAERHVARLFREQLP